MRSIIFSYTTNTLFSCFLFNTFVVWVCVGSKYITVAKLMLVMERICECVFVTLTHLYSTLCFTANINVGWVVTNDSG